MNIDMKRIFFLLTFEHIDYRCEDRRKVGELRGDIGAVR